MDGPIVSSPKKLWHGSRKSNLEIRELSVEETILQVDKFRQVFGGHISLTDSEEEAEIYARRLSPWENQTKFTSNPAIYTFEMHPKAKFFNADYPMNSEELMKYVGGGMRSLEEDSSLPYSPSFVSLVSLAQTINSSRFSAGISLFGWYSLINPENIEIFTPLNRAICNKNGLTGILGRVNSPDLGGTENMINDYSIHNLRQIRKISEKRVVETDEIITK